jgi:hypothetical protein
MVAPLPIRHTASRGFCVFCALCACSENRLAGRCRRHFHRRGCPAGHEYSVILPHGDQPNLHHTSQARSGVASLGDLGQDQLEPIIGVDPGIYRVVLTRDYDVEYEHFFVEEVSDYCPAGGPDWRVYMQRSSG